MTGRRARRWTGVLPVLLASLGAAAATAEGPEDQYRRLVDRYRSGDREAAGELAEAVNSGWLPRGPCQGGAECEAAAVLNLEAASRLLKAMRVDRATDLVGATRLLVNRQSPGFAFDWLLAAGLLHQSYGDHGHGFELFAAALDLRPDSPTALLARATALEASVIPDGFGGVLVAERSVWRLLYPVGHPPPELSHLLANPRSEKPYRRMLLDYVARQYRTILDLDSSSTEARLRLGRVLEARGRRAEAEAELRAAAASREDSFVAAIARLCLARFEPSPEGAAAAYRSALETDPTLSPAWLGLSQSLQASGDREGALAALERVLSLGDSRPLSAWIYYHFGRGRAFPEALEALRDGLTPPR